MLTGWKRWALIGMASALLAGGVFYGARTAYRAVKHWRADHLAEVASKRSESGALRVAFDKIRAAYQLTPNNLKVVRTFARLMDRIQPTEALRLWKKAVQIGGGKAKDRVGLIECALRIRDLEVAEKEIEKLREIDSPRWRSKAMFLNARWLSLQNRVEEAINLARKALNAEPERAPEDHLFYVQLTQFSNDKSIREEGIAHLRELSRRPDTLGLSALKNLARYQDMSKTERRKLSERLLAHPKQDLEAKLMALELKRKQPSFSPSKVRDFLTAHCRLERPQVALEVGRWLNRQGLSETTLEIIPKDRALQRQDLFLVRMDALAKLDRWDEIDATLKQDRVPIDAYLVRLFRGRARQESGKPQWAKLEWRHALMEAKGDPQELSYIADYARRLDFLELATMALKELTEFTAYRKRAYERLANLYSQQGKSAALMDVLRKMAEAFPDDPRIQNDLAYLQLLRGHEVKEAFKRAKQLHAQNPRVFAFKVTLALGWLRRNEPARAFAVFEGVSVNWRRLKPAWRVALAGVLQANGMTEGASTLLSEVSPDQLLPEERALYEAVSAGMTGK